ncbi:hypothetical protein F0249_05325 [Vibrio sp. 03-59-1]|uniref:hypothetical protein n=1 Tax=Vibrio sp. 03-59-1 TaxID=2607607 RepID=UPI0014932A9F|nr:hypothetical protein [Vibrio sp. 03-59-1]NOH83225.1 hypothetical protein [Vibrio sp. 03-59-1]
MVIKKLNINCSEHVASNNPTRKGLSLFLFFSALLFCEKTLSSSGTSSISIVEKPVTHTTLTNWESWKKIGEAQLSWLFFDVYKSTLYSPTGRYIQARDITPHPIALDIKYQRTISKKQLLDATEEQWNELKYPQDKQIEWLEILGTIFPNLKEGDRLVYVTDGELGKIYFIEAMSESDVTRQKEVDRETEAISKKNAIGDKKTIVDKRGTDNKKVIGEIADEELNDAFLAIWLSPKSSYPDLRSQLIGASQ